MSDPNRTLTVYQVQCSGCGGDALEVTTADIPGGWSTTIACVTCGAWMYTTLYRAESGAWYTTMREQAPLKTESNVPAH